MAEKEKKPAPRLALWCRPWEPSNSDSSDSTYLRAYIMRIDEKEEPRNCSVSDDFSHPGVALFDDFEMRAYISWYRGDWNVSWGYGYRGYMILDSLFEVERMVKGLTKATKIQRAFPVEPKTFGQFAVMLAAGFGVKEACHKRNHGGVEHWQIGPVQYAQGWIDEEVARLRKLKLGEEAAA